MSIEAMKQVLDAIQDLRGYRPDIDKAIEALRTAIQQAEAQQPATSEPVNAREALERIASWSEHPAMLGVDYGSNGVRDYYRKIARDALTHPAPGVPDAVDPPVEDGTEYDYCSGRAVGYAEGWNDCRAAMLAAAHAQKGQQ